VSLPACNAVCTLSTVYDARRAKAYVAQWQRLQSPANKWSQIAQCIMLITSSIADTKNYCIGQYSVYRYWRPY